MAIDIGTGLTITFLTSGFSANILAGEVEGTSRESIDTTAVGDTWRSFTPANVSDAGKLVLELQYNPDSLPPLVNTSEQARITFAGLEQWQGELLTTEFEIGFPLEETMTARASFKFSGEVVVRTLTPLLNPESTIVTHDGSTTVYVQ